MEKLQPPYEPKRKYWFLVKLPKAFEIAEWLINAVTAPTIKFIGENKYEWEEMTFTFYDPIGPSTSQRLWVLYRASNDNDDEIIPVSGEIVDLVKEGFDCKIQILDPTGVVVSEWDVLGCKITKINFGDFDTSKIELTKPSLTIKPTRAKLLY